MTNTAKSSLPYPTLSQTPNVPSDMGSLASALDGIVIPKYANATARNTANPTPANGDMCFQTDVAAHLVYRSTFSAWKCVGVVVLADQIFNGSQNTVTFSSIPNIATHLRITYTLRSAHAVFSAGANLNINGVTTANYGFTYWDTSNSAGTMSSGFVPAGSTFNVIEVNGASYTSASRSSGEVMIPDYASTKDIQCYGWGCSTDGGTSLHSRNFAGAISVAGGSAPVTSITITENNASNFTSGSRITLYGMP